MENSFIFKRVNLKRKSKKLYLKIYNNNKTKFVENPFDAVSFLESENPYLLFALIVKFGYSVRPVRKDFECYKYLHSIRDCSFIVAFDGK